MLVEAQNLAKEGPGQGEIDDVVTHLDLIKEKEAFILSLNEKILELIDESDVEANVQVMLAFEVKLRKDIALVKKLLDDR